MDKFKKLLEREKLLPIWPTTPTGAVKTDKKTLEKFEDNNKIFQFQTVQSFRKNGKLMTFRCKRMRQEHPVIFLCLTILLRALDQLLQNICSTCQELLDL